MTLNLEPSRLLWVWWWGVHALLVAAVALAALPTWAVALAVLATVIHGVVRRPAVGPRVVLIAEGGLCTVPEWRTGLTPLGARTLMCPLWVRLDLGTGPWPRYIFLMADQVGPDEWRRLRARLMRCSSAT